MDTEPRLMEHGESGGMFFPGTEGPFSPPEKKEKKKVPKTPEQIFAEAKLLLLQYLPNYKETDQEELEAEELGAMAPEISGETLEQKLSAANSLLFGELTAYKQMLEPLSGASEEDRTDQLIEMAGALKWVERTKERIRIQEEERLKN